MSSRILKTLTVVAFATTLAACSSVPLEHNQSSSSGAGEGSAAAGQVMDPFNPQSPLYQQRSVYFDFNKYNIKEQYRPLIEMHSRYLVAHPSQKVQVQGNTDARGSAEYNLALGQRRSEAVAHTMTLLGVNSDQIEAISYGKERPKAAGTTEADYAENRRADIVYQH
ncbi:MAG: peptidoglycan-associated lipoprotein Pal [Candidimonas sp.]|nr:MAG: peptidoglycan-associated lipoprotein Pal [Candidimonas sp.]